MSSHFGDFETPEPDNPIPEPEPEFDPDTGAPQPSVDDPPWIMPN